MPKKPIDYSKACIYKIVCKDPTIKDCYVGSTTDLIRRRGQHKTVCNNANRNSFNFLVYQFIRENGGWDNWEVLHVEDYPCSNKNELEKREREVLEELAATLNRVIPTRTKKEYKQTDTYKAQDKRYREQNREEILQKKKDYYYKVKGKISEKKLCPCGTYYQVQHKARHYKSKKHQNYVKQYAKQLAESFEGSTENLNQELRLELEGQEIQKRQRKT